MPRDAVAPCFSVVNGLPATIDYLKTHYRARLMLFGPRFYFDDPGALLTRASTYAEANQRFDAAKGLAANERELAALSAIAERTGVDLVDLRPYACDKTAGGWSCPLLLEDGALLYWDFHHWTDAGARRVGTRLRADGRYAFLF